MQPYIVSFEINMIFQENSMVKHAQHAGSNTTSETDVPPKAIYKWDGGTEERDWILRVGLIVHIGITQKVKGTQIK